VSNSTLTRLGAPGSRIIGLIPPLILCLGLSGCGSGSQSASCSSAGQGTNVAAGRHGLNAPVPTRKKIGQWGTIQFGVNVHNNFTLTDQGTSFPVQKAVAWVAYFSRNVSHTTVIMQIYKLVCGQKVREWSTTDPMPNQPVNEETFLLDPFTRLEHNISSPGTYIVQYNLGSQVIARGQFTLTPPTSDSSA